MKYYFFGVLSLLFLYFIHPISLQGSNVDLGYHLKVGELIANTSVIPKTNIFSYTSYGFPYVYSSWLGETALYYCYSFFGFNGLLILFFIIAVVTFYLLFQNSEIKQNYYASFLVFLLYIHILVDRIEVKIEWISLLFLSLTLFILFKNKQKCTKLLYLLPFIQVLWVNMHLFFIVGWLTILLFFIESVFHYKKINSSVFQLGGVLVASFFVHFINPQFIKGALYPLTVFTNYGYQVNENSSLFEAIRNHWDISLLYFITALLLLFILTLYFHKKMQKISIVLAIVFSLLAIIAVRNISLFVIGTFIPMVLLVNELLKQIEKSKYNQFMINTKYFIGFIVLVFCVPGMIWAFSIHGFGFGIKDEAKDAIQLLQKYQIKGNIYNNYNIGNYLIYANSSQKTFVYGSPEAFPHTFFSSVYYPIEDSYTMFQKYAKKYKFTIIFYDHVNQTSNENALLQGLINDKDWQLVFLNNRIIVFVKNIPDNKKIILEQTLTQQKVNSDFENIDSLDTLKSLSNIYRLLNWYERMADIDLRYLEIEPHNCTALRHVSAYMSYTNHPLVGMYAQRYQQHCH